MSEQSQSKSTKKSRQKPNYPEHNSISTLQVSENTRKGISTEQIILEPTHVRSSLHGKASMHTYSLPLPSGIQVSMVIQLLRERIGSEVIYSNEQKGQMLVQGPRKASFWDTLDCLLCWKMQGSSKGALAHCYHVIAIRISKQVIEQRCTITVKPSHPKSKDPYYMSLIKLIQSEVKALPQSPSHSHKILTNALEYDSPLYRQINAYKSIERNFSVEGDKRYKVLYEKAVERVNQQILKSKEEASRQKKIDLVEAIVNESNSLYTAFTYDQPQNNSIHPQYRMYSIESFLCKSVMDQIRKVYYGQTQDQCLKFNQQVKFINDNLSNEECWEYLQCRGKYRLPSQSQPYMVAILNLKQVQFANSFRQMLLSIQKCFSEAKVACLIEHKGALQLATMDDVLPVMIYIVLRAGVANFPTYVKMVDDYVRARATFQLQERVITSLYVAVEDITKKWVMKQKMPEEKSKSKSKQDPENPPHDKKVEQNRQSGKESDS